MKNQLKLLLLAASAVLCACSMIPLPGEPAAHKVSVDGDIYILKQLTESTWTANAGSSVQPLAATVASTAALRMVVEKTSGCKVTDSDYSRQGKQFDAQVDCASRLPN
ncbi:MAG: hypothetical protein JWP96_443 [Polaromonas sp.]|nr:hypothetical protein [Polaromonas sp.]